MQPKWIKKSERGVLLFFKAQPRSSKTEIVGLYGEEYLKIKIKALPESGKANEELIEYLADIFDVSKSKLRLLQGRSSVMKSVEVLNVSMDDVLELLKQILNRGR